MYRDRRKNRRYNINPIMSKINSQGAQYLGFIMDLSETGAHFRLSTNLDEDRFSVSIPLPQELDNGSITLDIQKVWSTDENSTNSISVGCEFTNLTEHNKELIQKLASHYKKEVRWNKNVSSNKVIDRPDCIKDEESGCIFAPNEMRQEHGLSAQTRISLCLSCKFFHNTPQFSETLSAE